MKRGWIALAMIGLSLLLGGIEYAEVAVSTDMYIAMLDEADAHIAANEIADAGSTAERLERRFSGQSGMLEFFLYHSEVGNISNDLSMLPRYARAGEIGEFTATSARARTEILALKNAKQLRWENVF